MDQKVTWSSDNVTIATVENGVVKAVAAGTATITAQVMKSKATCKVTVVLAPVTGLTLDKTEVTINSGATETVTATVTPEYATDKTVTWTSDNPGVATVEAGVITAVSAGDAVITAKAGEYLATCKVKVNALQPKIGDYFYSDGTWSNGGLTSIEADGMNPVWAETKPAPLAGKTVIGIVFQTFDSRISQADKDAGYVHGYVMAVKTAHNAEKVTTYWSKDWEFSCLNGAKLASTWYKNTNGYGETAIIRNFYKGELAAKMPAFDLVLNHFTPAPASTSGWFLPSTGQMWDMMANLCGGEVATIMKKWQTLGRDATYYCSEKAKYDVLARFNSVMALVPAADKEDLGTIDKGKNYGSTWTSTPYDGESACMMNIGQDGLIECMTEWYDGDCVARPILAF